MDEEMSQMKKVISLVLCVIMLLMLFSGCSSTGANTTSSAGSSVSASTAASENEPQKIVFGAALPLTGAISIEGSKHLNGYKLWEKVVNENGGIEVAGKKYPVEIKYYDFQSDNAIAVKLVEKLITEDKVNFILGPNLSSSAKAVSPVIEKYQIPMIAPSASAKDVYNDGYKYLFGTFTPDNTICEPMVELAMQLDDPPKTIAIVTRNDLFPVSLGNATKEAAEEAGIEVVMFDQYSIGTTDYAPLLIQVAATNPDWIFVTGYAQDLVLMRNQMIELNIKAKMISIVSGAMYPEFIAGTGEGANYITSAGWWHNSVTYEGIDVFGTSANYTKVFEDEYGYTPDLGCATASVAGCIFQNAIERAGSLDPVKVRDALAESDFLSFFGPIKFDEHGQASALTPPVVQIIDQKHVPMYPPEIAQAKLVYPMPDYNN